MSPDMIYKLWLSSDREVQADHHAKRLLDRILIQKEEPIWDGQQRDAFFLWCQARGLTP